MTKFYTWQEVYIIYGVVGTGIMYCLYKRFLFKRRGGDVSPVARAETPGDDVIIPKQSYSEEEIRLKRRYERNKMTPMEDHIQEAYDSCIKYNYVAQKNLHDLTEVQINDSHVDYNFQGSNK